MSDAQYPDETVEAAQGDPALSATEPLPDPAETGNAGPPVVDPLPDFLDTGVPPARDAAAASDTCSQPRSNDGDAGLPTVDSLPDAPDVGNAGLPSGGDLLLDPLDTSVPALGGPGTASGNPELPPSEPQPSAQGGPGLPPSEPHQGSPGLPTSEPLLGLLRAGGSGLPTLEPILGVLHTGNAGLPTSEILNMLRAGNLELPTSSTGIQGGGPGRPHVATLAGMLSAGNPHLPASAPSPLSPMMSSGGAAASGAGAPAAAGAAAALGGAAAGGGVVDPGSEAVPRSAMAVPIRVRVAGRRGVEVEAWPNSAAFSWQRPWETIRDRSTYAMSFAAAFAMDVFIELSRTFLHAVRLGLAENQPVHSAEATVRLDDVYHLHTLVHSTHDSLAQAVGALNRRRRGQLQQLLGTCAGVALLTVVLVHLAFMSPMTQVEAATGLSRAVYKAAAAHSEDLLGDSCLQPQQQHTEPNVVVKLEVSNAWWLQPWLQPHAKHLERLLLQGLHGSQKAAVASSAGSQANATAVEALNSVMTKWLSEIALRSYRFAFPLPQYEVRFGGDSATLLEVQSPSARAALGVQVVHLGVSAQDPALFGPLWARGLLSILWLYDVYVLHALPAYVAEASTQDAQAVGFAPEEAPRLHALVVGSSQPGVDLGGMLERALAARRRGWKRLQLVVQRALWASVHLPAAFVGTSLLLALFRRLLVLSVRMSVYSSYMMRQMRRYAFIAEPLRRINCYSSTELLELWASWGSLAALTAWLLAEAWQMRGLWAGMLLLLMLGEYWGLAHVRTKQSQWIFPRSMLLLHGGTLVYATWWPLCPGWLLLWALTMAQLFLMFVLLCRFDCFATLPDQRPHRLLFRSSLLPSVPLSRSRRQQPAAAAAPPPPPRQAARASGQGSGAAVAEGAAAAAAPPPPCTSGVECGCSQEQPETSSRRSREQVWHAVPSASSFAQTELGAAGPAAAGSEAPDDQREQGS